MASNPAASYFWSSVIFSYSPKLKSYPIYVSDSPSPTGVKAFYTYLEKKENGVKRWSHSPE